MTLPRLMVLTDRHQLPPGRDFVDTYARCHDAGLTHIVLREIDLPLAARCGLAADLAARGLHVIAAYFPLRDGFGVHLRADQPMSDAEGHAFGRSCHSVEDVARAATEGATWVMLSPFADSRSKPGRRPLPRDAFTAAARLGVAVFALGGIDHTTAASARAAGAHGVAVMGAVARASDPAAEIRRLHEALRSDPVTRSVHPASALPTRYRCAASIVEGDAR